MDILFARDIDRLEIDRLEPAESELVERGTGEEPLTGKTGDFGGLILESRGLKINVAGEEYTDEADKGRIFRQSPAAGKSEKSGRTVDVWVSKGLMEVSVPDIKGLSQKEASDLLQKNNLVLSATEEEESAEVEKGKVIYSRPPAGTALLRNSAVVVILSSGKKMTTVPRVTGKTLSRAKRMLKAKLLVVGTVKKETNIDRAFDIILRQYPPAGRKVPEGTSVTVVVNAESN